MAQFPLLFLLFIKKYANSLTNTHEEVKQSLVNFIRMRETVTEMATGCQRSIKMDIFALYN